MEKIFQTALQALFGSLLVFSLSPVARSHSCTINTTSDGFFTQTGNGNTFSTRSTGGYQAQVNVVGYSNDFPLTFGPTSTTLPTGLSSNKVTITYTFTTDSGLTLYEGTDQDLLASPFSYTGTLPSSFSVFIDVSVQQQSGIRASADQYQLSLDISC